MAIGSTRIKQSGLTTLEVVALLGLVLIVFFAAGYLYGKYANLQRVASQSDSDNDSIEVFDGFEHAPASFCIGPTSPLTLNYRVYVNKAILGGETGLIGDVDFFIGGVTVDLNPATVTIEKEHDGRAATLVSYFGINGSTYIRAVYEVPTTGEKFESRSPDYEVDGAC